MRSIIPTERKWASGRQMKRLIPVLILFFSFSFPVTAMAEQENGTDQGNGGDGYAAEFVSVGRTLLLFVKAEAFLHPSVKLNFIEAVDEVQVESTNGDLFLAGIPKDALNFPSKKKIIFNRTRWNLMSAKAKYALVLHEYFGVINEENASYGVSARILAKIFFGPPSCAFSDPGAPRFLVPPRPADTRSYIMQEAKHLGLRFVLRIDGNLLLLEAAGESGDIVASASTTLDSTGPAPKVSLRLRVAGEGRVGIEVACSSQGYPTRK